MGKLIYLTGPVRSGKSRRAVDLAREWGDHVVFIATYQTSTKADNEMDERVRRHRAERPAWRTLEAPTDMATALTALAPTPSGVIIDCLTLWTSARFDRHDEEILKAWSTQLEYLRAAVWPVVIVSNEIGWAPVPADPALRRFRDLVGTLAQRTAAAANEAWLMVAGCPIRLK